jgi:hypothetical protein
MGGRGKSTNGGHPKGLQAGATQVGMTTAIEEEFI